MSKELVLDAMALIYSAKSRLHEFFPQMDAVFWTTPAVKREVMGDFRERPVLEKLFGTTLKVREPEKLLRQPGLGEGESSALALAKQFGCTLVSDDGLAHATAKSLAIGVVHTSSLLFLLLAERKISAGEAQKLLRELVESGWWCDAATLLRIIAKIKEYE